jgi:hypothetical protein
VTFLKKKFEGQDLSKRFGVSIEELANPETAVKLVTQKAEEGDVESVVEEGALGDLWDWIKSKSATIYMLRANAP